MRPEWHVFPLKYQSKQPATQHGVKDARPMASWPGETQDQMALGALNVGLACGGPSGIYVIDLDGMKGLGSWEGLEAFYGDSPTLISVTGSGGIHRVYSIPEALGELPNTAGKLGPGIDTRGNGGYIVCPPSVHPNGTPYRWLSWRDPEPLPQWIVDKVKGEAPATQRRPRAIHYKADKDDRLAVRILQEECEEVAACPPGARNHTLFRCAASMAELVGGGELTAGTMIDAMTAAGLACGLSRPEVDRTISSALKTGYENPRIIRTRSQA